MIATSPPESPRELRHGHLADCLRSCGLTRAAVELEALRLDDPLVQRFNCPAPGPFPSESAWKLMREVGTPETRFAAIAPVLLGLELDDELRGILGGSA